ncbi:hypothetical protein AAMO2058_001458100 [Amorphochlora amoebiformis]
MAQPRASSPTDWTADDESSRRASESNARRSGTGCGQGSQGSEGNIALSLQTSKRIQSPSFGAADSKVGRPTKIPFLLARSTTHTSDDTNDLQDRASRSDRKSRVYRIQIRNQQKDFFKKHSEAAQQGHRKLRSQPIGNRSWMSIKKMLETIHSQSSKTSDTKPHDPRVLNSTTGDQRLPFSVAEIPGKGLYQHFKNDIMISYCRRDKDQVRKIVDGLNNRGIDPWVDWKDIPPATDWKKEIQMGIQKAYATVACLSPNYLKSEYCRDEIEIAREHGKLLVPVVVGHVDYEKVWPELAKVNWIFMRGDDNFMQGMKKLMDALHVDYDYVQRHAELCRYERRPRDDRETIERRVRDDRETIERRARDDRETTERRARDELETTERRPRDELERERNERRPRDE